MAPGSFTNIDYNTRSTYTRDQRQVPYEVIHQLPSHYSEWVLHHIRDEYTCRIYEMMNVYTGEIFCVAIHMSCDVAPFAGQINVSPYSTYGTSVYDQVKEEQKKIIETYTACFLNEKAKKLNEEKQKKIAEEQLKLKQQQEHKKRQFRRVYWHRQSKEKIL